MTLNSSITSPNELEPNLDLTHVRCFGNSDGAADASPTGGTLPYQYLWSTGSPQAIVNNLPAGTHTVTVTDQNGCLAIEEFDIAQPAQLSMTIEVLGNAACDGSYAGQALVTGAGGNPPYNYTWSTGSTSDTLTWLNSGSFSVALVDSSGCDADSSIMLDCEPVGIGESAAHVGG